MTKKENVVNDPIALVAEKGKGKSVRYSSSSKRSDDSEEESDDEMEKEMMMDNLLSVANNFRKKFYNRPGSNNRRMSSKPRAYEDRERYIPRQNDRYDINKSSRHEGRDDRQYEDRYSRASERKEFPDKIVERKEVDSRKFD